MSDVKNIILLSVMFILFLNSLSTEETIKLPAAEPPNLLELGMKENNVMIINHDAAFIGFFHVIQHHRVSLTNGLQNIFPILPDATSITVTESITNSVLEHDEYYIIWQMGDLNWLEFQRFPEFLKDKEEFILTIQYYRDFKDPFVTYRNFWRICFHNLKYLGGYSLDRLSIILPQNAFLWNSNRELDVATRIKEVKRYDVDVKGRIGISWYIEEEKPQFKKYDVDLEDRTESSRYMIEAIKIPEYMKEEKQCIELGFGTQQERMRWENRETTIWFIILILVGFFLTLMTLLMSAGLKRYNRHRDRIKRIIILFSLLLLFWLLIFSYLHYLPLEEFPIPINLWENTKKALIILSGIYILLIIYMYNRFSEV